MIVVAGEALIDLIVAPDGALRAAPGGGPFNAARTVARLGVPCGFLGRFSTDRFGDRLLATLAADGVLGLVPERTDAPTTLAVAEIDADGAASYRFYLEGTAAPDLRPAHAMALPPHVQALHLGSLGLVLQPMSTTIEALVPTVGDDVIVLVDLNCRPHAIDDHRAYRDRVAAVATEADIVKASVEDLQFLRPDLAPLEAANQLLGDRTCLVLVTDGGDAAHVVQRSGSTRLPVQPVAVADTVGAGDAFGAAFLAWWLRNDLDRSHLLDHATVTRAAAAASVVATDTCTRSGAEPPWVKDLVGQGW